MTKKKDPIDLNERFIIDYFKKAYNNIESKLDELETTPFVKKKFYEGIEIRPCPQCYTFNSYETSYFYIEGKYSQSVFHCDNCKEDTPYRWDDDGKKIIK